MSTEPPLRVGLVCPYSFDTPGGVQNHVLGLARHLRASGHQPYVLAPGEPARALGAVERDHFTSAGAAVPVRYNGSVARVNFGPRSAARVRRWLAGHDFDLLHIHEPITPSIAILALWAAEVPVVATFHTATPRSRTMQLAGRSMRSAIEKIDAGIAVSETARNVVVQHLGRDAVVIPNGFGLADFPGPAAPTGRWRGGDHPRLVFLGRLDEPRKGLDVLLAAGPAIRRRHPGVEVVVAGQGSRELPPWCRSLGLVSDQVKADLLATADVFVAPHRERESFGIVLLEAMASGAPVVASDLAPFVDLIGRSSERGELFTTGDPDALAAAVGRTLDHADPARTARARQVAERYDWSVVGTEVRSVYQAAWAVARPEPSVVTRADRAHDRVERAHHRVERARAALDAALVRRAQRVAELAGRDDLDPATALLLSDSAAAVLELDLDADQREAAESDLSHTIDAVGLAGVAAEQERASLGRRLHNDAVAAARARRDRVGVRMFRTTGPTPAPRAFEMADPRGGPHRQDEALGWARDR